MSDFGADMGGQAAQISANASIKLSEAIAKLLGAGIKFIVETNSYENRAAKIEYKNLKFEKDKKEFLKSLNLTAGEVNHAKLVKYGVPLVNLGIGHDKISESEFKAFAKICKNEGVIISGLKLTDTETSKPYYLLECRESDLDRIQLCLDKYNDEKILKQMNDKLSEYSEKGINNLSQTERMERAELLTQKAELLNKQNRVFNDTQTYSVVANAFKPIEPERRENFEKAVNRLKDNYINRDLNFVVADMANPEKHIKCHAYMDKYVDDKGLPFIHQGKSEYIKTDYAVFGGDNLLMESNDGWDNVKSVNDWFALRDEMKNVGGFSGEMIRFETVKDYESFMNQRALTNEADKGIINVADYSDCSAVIGKLEKYLDENGYKAEYTTADNGEPLRVDVVDINSGERLSDKPFNFDNKMEAMINADCLVAGEKLSNYKQLEWHSNEMKIASAEMGAYAEGSPEYLETKDNYDNAFKAVESLKDKEAHLNNERHKLISSKAEHVRNETEHAERVDARAADTKFINEGNDEITDDADAPESPDKGIDLEKTNADILSAKTEKINSGAKENLHVNTGNEDR